MKILNKFSVNIQKNKVINAVKSYYNAPLQELETAYSYSLDIFNSCTKPFGVYKVIKENHGIEIIKHCKYAVYCLVTVGDSPSAEVDKLFDTGKFTEALLLDAIGSYALFSISSEMYNIIYSEAMSLGLGLSCKIAPGDGEIDIDYQRIIAGKLADSGSHGITVNEHNILTPFKSMSYIYGADDALPFNKTDHDCGGCSNINCHMRNTTVEIRGVFL